MSVSNRDRVSQYALANGTNERSGSVVSMIEPSISLTRESTGGTGINRLTPGSLCYTMQ